jgi:hypothetical protein
MATFPLTKRIGGKFIRTITGDSFSRAVEAEVKAGRSLANADLTQLGLHGDPSALNLESANLTNTNMRGVYLAGAILNRITVTGADVTGASVRGATAKFINLTSDTVAGTTGILTVDMREVKGPHG